MNHLLIAGLSIPLLLIFLALRIHVGIALGFTGFLGFWALTGKLDVAMALLTTTPYATVANYSLVVLPLFILMGSLAGHAGLAEDAYRAAEKWVGKLPGGLAIATTMANAAFGAASGSSIAACAVFTEFSLPEMERHGYQSNFAGAAIAAAGLLAMLIPPSVLMIVYGILTSESIGALFLAGVFPGLLLTVLYCVAIPVMVKTNPKLAPQAQTAAVITWKERFLSLRNVWGIVVLMLLVIGGIYSGIFTPTEAGAAAAFGALVIGLGLRKLNRQKIWGVMLEAGRTTALVFLILIGAMIFSKFLAASGATAGFVNWVTSSGLPPLAVLGCFIVMYLVLGCLLDSISMMTITLPLVFPVATALKWDPIWFAIIVIFVIEMGLVTPPMGLNVYTVKAVAGESMGLEGLFRSILPFLAVMALTLVILVAFPQIATWLPGLTYR